MTNAQILYQDEILKYGRQPNNRGVLADANLQLQGDSPICGDHLRLYLRVDAGRVQAVSFSSSACCALCMASASMMTDAIRACRSPGARLARTVPGDGGRRRGRGRAPADAAAGGLARLRTDTRCAFAHRMRQPFLEHARHAAVDGAHRQVEHCGACRIGGPLHTKKTEKTRCLPSYTPWRSRRAARTDCSAGSSASR
ncbi:iron-sulfur cluster assembly scaffold protein [Massilia sp. Dwa41.01b]|nr:iron-sulfur cluster assembly scaffold protein [Massilia sp. Dwa41.01b]